MRGWRLARVALLPKSVKRIPVLTLDRRPVGNLVLGEAENQGLRPHPMESPRSVGGRGMFVHACRVATAIHNREAHGVCRGLHVRPTPPVRPPPCPRASGLRLLRQSWPIFRVSAIDLSPCG